MYYISCVDHNINCDKNLRRNTGTNASRIEEIAAAKYELSHFVRQCPSNFKKICCQVRVIAFRLRVARVNRHSGVELAPYSDTGPESGGTGWEALPTLTLPKMRLSWLRKVPRWTAAER